MAGSLLADLRYAVRLLKNAPTFTLVAVGTLALGIGVNVAVFSVVNAVLFRPLPYPDAGQLVVVSEMVQRDRLERRALSYPDFVDLRRRTSSFEGIAAWAGEVFTLASPDAPARRVDGELVSSGYFDLLGATTVAGRTFSAAEADERGGHPIAMVSHAFAQQQFGTPAAAIGQTLTLNDRAFTVVGVTAPGFAGLSESGQIWIPFGMLAAVEPARYYDARGARWFDAVAKLNAGVSLEQARADLAAVGRQLEQSYPGTNAHYRAAVFDLRAETVGQMEPLLLTLLGAVGFVLLIACVNLANLLLARASARQRETAIRAALGADRFRLARQFLAEGALLSGIGTAGGILVALWSTDTIASLAPTGLPAFVRPHLDTHVLAFIAGITITCTVLLGLLPAAQASRPDVNGALKDGTRGSSGGTVRTRMRATLVIAEVALSLLLLSGAGLMVRTFVNLQRVDVGFQPDRTATLRIALPRKYAPARLPQVMDAVLGRVQSVPGVDRAAASTDVPFNGHSSAILVSLESQDAADDAAGRRVYVHDVTPAFFATLGVPLVAGRDFASADDEASPRVAIVSQRFATMAWGDGDPIGKRFTTGRAASPSARWISVIGVAADVRFRTLRPEEGPQDPDIYFPLRQQPDRGVTIVASTTLRPEAVLTGIRDAVQQFDRDIPVSGERALSSLINERTASFRLGASVMSCFGIVALLLAGIGIFGLINYSVAQRRRELGVRAALGAGRTELYGLVLKDAGLLTASGIAAGLAAAFPATRLMASQLYGVTPADPLTYAAIVLVLLLVSVSAAALPAHRAARIDPVIALRSE